MNYRMRNMVALLGIALGSLHPDASRAAVPSPEGPPGRILYVSADGNDDAAGTSLRPFKTLQKGVSVLRPGDTLNVRSGSYDGFLLGWDDGGIYGPIKGTAAAPITIQLDPAAPADSAIITAQNNKTQDAIDLEKGNSWIIIRGLTVRNSGKIPRSGIRVTHSDHIRIINNSVSGVKLFGIFCSFTTDFVVQGNRLIDNPGTGDPASGHGIYISNSSVDPIIRGNYISKSGSQALHLNGDADAGGIGLITGALIEDNVIVNNINNGINADGLQNSRIQNNLIIASTRHGISLYHIDAAAGSKNNVIVNNTIVQPNAAGAAIKLSAGSTGNTILNNILLGGASGAIAISNDSRAGLTSDNNIVVDHFENNDTDATYSLARWRIESGGQDQHSLTGKSPADLFVNATVGDFRLSPKGPAMGAGRKPPAPSGGAATQAGSATQPQPGAWDIGAHPPADAIAPAAMEEIKKAALAFPLHGRRLRIALGVGMLSLVAVGGWFPLRSRGLHRWLFSYCMHAGRRGDPAADEQVHALICIGDHFEPHNGQVSDQQARARLDHWLKHYPASFTQFRDADGRFPQHTFFYPVEQYRADHVESIASLCRAGFGEIEIHLHHDNDTSDNLRRSLEDGKNLLASRHGLLARHRTTGELAYGFIHGDWALDNSSPDGRGCGVNNELDILRETGCYADFTLPSAPSLAQTSKINSIYYAVDDPHRPMSHNTGTDVGRAPRPEKSLVLIQGPLLFNWGRRKFGVIPGVENACLQGNQQASMARLDLWLRARVQVPQRPDWFFIKLHAHGANEDGHQAILSNAMVQFHRDLAERSRRNPNFHYHYVTAREMYNLARAAEAGWAGSVADARNFELVSNFADRERKKTA